MPKLIPNFKKTINSPIFFIVAIFLGTYFFSPILTSAAGDTWYWRPASGGPYGTSDGKSYEDAWQFSNQIIWGPGGVDAGDTLYVCGLHDAGYLDRNIEIGASGTPNAPIVVSGACPGDPGTILSAGVKFIGPTGWGDAGFGAYVLQYQGSTGNQAIEDGTLRLKRETKPPDATWQAGSFYQEGPGTTLYYKPSSGTFADHIFYTQADHPIKITSKQDVHIVNLVIKNAGTCVTVSNSQRVVIKDNTIEWCSGAGIAIWNASHDGKILNNTIRNIKNGIYFVSSDNSMNSNRWNVSGNTIYGIDQEGYYGSGDTHGIGIQGTNNSIFERNEIHHGGAEGLGFYAFSKNAQQKISNNIVRYNYIHDLKSLASYPQNEWGIFFGSDNAPNLPENVFGNQVYGNIIANVGVGIRTKTAKIPNGYSWSYFSNTIYNANIGFLINGNTGEIPGALFQNNIIANISTAHVFVQYAGDTGGITLENNLYYPDGPLFKIATTSGTTWTAKNLSDWQTFSGKDNSSFTGQSPLFINASGTFSQPSDFRLQQTSPAIDRGGVIVNSFLDYDGKGIIGIPDIGAFEFQSLPLIATTPTLPPGSETIIDTTPPTGVTNLSGTSTSPTQISLSWSPAQDNQGTLYYRVARGDALSHVTANTAFLEAGLTPNTTYTYTVEAVDGGGNVSPTATISVTTPPSLSLPTTTTTPPLIPPQTPPSSTVTLLTLQGPFGIGYRNDQVKLLQEMLIKDGSFSGEVTGYYGPLTTQAVQKFQTKYGIITSGTPSTTGYGLAGPGTRAKLNQLYGGSGGTTDQEALIASLRKQVADLTALLQTLIAKLAALKAV